MTTNATELAKRLRNIRCRELLTGNDRLDAATLIEQQAERIAECERILDGLPQDAIDGGWTARGMSAYAKKLEAERDALKAQMEAAQKDPLSPV
jgi:hypothetical protein